MDQHVTREILWNIQVGFVVFLYGMLIPLAAAFIYVGWRWYRTVRLGTAATRPRFDQPMRRLFLAFRDGIGQGYVGRESWKFADGHRLRDLIAHLPVLTIASPSAADMVSFEPLLNQPRCVRSEMSLWC